MTRFNMPENVPLQHPLVSRAIQQAQVKVEGFHFDARKHLVEYDDVLNKQREIIYAKRRKILEALDSDSNFSFKDEILQKIQNTITAIVTINTTEDVDPLSQNERIVSAFCTIIPFDQTSGQQLIDQLKQKTEIPDKVDFLTTVASDIYSKREKEMGKELTRQVEGFVLRSVIDMLWMDHLDAIENLRGGIGLRGYAQRDPLVEYKNEAFAMFDQLITAIDDDVVHRIYKIQVQQASVPADHVHQHEVQTNNSKSNYFKNQESVVQKSSLLTNSTKKGKLGRNDSCWCGSGKKWKKCHLNREPQGEGVR